MNINKIRNRRRNRRKRGIRKRVFGTPTCPRLSVYRSQKHIYAQLIDDIDGKTLVAANTAAEETGNNTAAATEVGKVLAEKAKQAGITTAAFDRNGFRYHGRVKALADGAREGGLKF